MYREHKTYLTSQSGWRTLGKKYFLDFFSIGDSKFFDFITDFDFTVALFTSDSSSMQQLLIERRTGQANERLV